MNKAQIALQLYSVRDQINNSFENTVKAVAEMGYEGVELSGLRENDVPKEIKAILDYYGLAVPSSHVPFKDMCDNPTRVFTDYKIVGCDFIVIPWLSQDSELSANQIDATIDKIRNIGKQAKQYGLTLLYHNHNFEFDIINGEYILDRLYRLVEKEFLQTQLDTCWVNVGGENPAEYIKKYSNRTPLVHLKDFVCGGKAGLYELIGTDIKKEQQNGNFAFCPIGYGVQNFRDITSAAEQAGALWMIVEQDSSEDMPTLEAARLSREYLRSIGY